MIARVVMWALESRFLVALATLGLVILGVRGYRTLPIDAVPDTSNVQVQVLTNAPGLSPLEVEALVTRPIELAMAGLPDKEVVRSISRAGVSAVTIVFRDDVELAAARNLVAQRLTAAREAIPASAGRPAMGPLTTGLGEIYHFTLRWPGHTARDLRTLLEWEIAYPLRAVPGVVEVNAWGGDERQVEVRLDLNALRALGVSQGQVEEAILGGGQNAGAGSLERGDEQVLVRLDGQYRTAVEVGAQVVATGPGGVPVRVRDVARVVDGAGIRVAAATADGEGETVYAMVQMIAGGNAHEVTADVKRELAAIEKRLPEGVTVEPFYDRASLVDRVLSTVRHSLLEGGLIVVVVLLIFLGDLRSGLVVATAIPLSMLGAFALMREAGMSGNLMSLGAIDFGLVVDGAVVMVEGALTTMSTRGVDARDALGREARAVGRPIAFGIFIIAVVYVPVLLLQGVEGKMFRPMAWTVLFALGTSLVLTFTWIPALGSLVLKRTAHEDPWVVRKIRRVYGPFLEWILARPKIAAAAALVLVLAGVGAGWGRGSEFVPRLEEGDLVVQVTRPPSVSLAEAIRGTSIIESTLRRYPEVKRVISRTGSPDVATDVMGIEQSDVFILLRPPAEWKTATTREALVALFERDLRRALPGTGFSFTQPIEMRAQELLGGLKSDVGVKIFGDDMGALTHSAADVAQLIAAIPGAADVRVEPTSGLPLATLRPNVEKMARLGVKSAELRASVEAIRAGRVVGVLVEGERRFPVAVRLDVTPDADPSALAQVPVTFSDGRSLPLGDLCDIVVEEGPAQISREQARRRVLVEANVRGRDLGSFVQELNRRLGALRLPPGYYLSVSGQYENLVHASARLAVIVPATLALIFVLLYLIFDRLRPGALIFLNVPIAASGGVLALAVRGLPFSISAAIGFIALFGVATLNGVVLVSAARRHEEEGVIPREAARRAAHERLRPVLTTAIVASLGFVPMALATGAGAEVQRPLATVVIGGLVTATLLTLGLLPTFYGMAKARPQEP